MKAIAEAEKAKKEFISIVQKENDQKVKNETKAVAKNETKGSEKKKEAAPIKAEKKTL